MWKRRVLKGCAVWGLIVLGTAPAVAREKKDTLILDIEDSDGSKLTLSLSADIVSGIIDGVVDEDLECDSDIDPDTRAMFEYLSREGKGSRYTLEKEDGEIVKARRRGDQLELEVLEPDEKPTRVSMPWLLAECMLGSKVAAEELQKADGLQFSVAKDGGLAIRVE
jgi:hypothetical protein